MKFSTRQDIEAPIEFVFDRTADFDALERQALRRGIEVDRADNLNCNGCGMQWNVRFPFRGKSRKAKGELTEYDVPNSYLIQSVSGGVEADFDVEFLPLSRGRTRVIVGLQLSPKSLSAKLLVQSLKLVKSSLDERFANRIKQFASDIQNRYSTHIS
ncbi:MAG: SRPBCC family protein [Paracoccaceae bacterium]